MDFGLAAENNSSVNILAFLHMYIFVHAHICMYTYLFHIYVYVPMYISKLPH